MWISIIDLLHRSRVPPNVRFQLDDAEQDWAFPRDSFDFIHIRGLAGSIRNWPELLRQSYMYVHARATSSRYVLAVSNRLGAIARHLKPGGQIEVSEGRPHMDCDDGSFPKESHTWKWIVSLDSLTQPEAAQLWTVARVD